MTCQQACNSIEFAVRYLLGQSRDRNQFIRGGLNLFGSAFALALLVAAPACAQSVEEFYRGKTINFVIGYPTAGPPDIYARLVGRHMGKYIPGNPNIIARNMPGAGSLIAANHVFNVAPKDGTTFAYDVTDHTARGNAGRAPVEISGRRSSTGSADWRPTRTSPS